jgi:hypothetical protein
VVKRLVWDAVPVLLLVVVLAMYTAVPELRPYHRVGNTLIYAGLFMQSLAQFLGYIVSHSKLRRSLGRRKCLVLAMASWIVIATVIATGYGSFIGYYTNGAPLYMPWTGALLWLLGLTVSGRQAAP